MSDDERSTSPAASPVSSPRHVPSSLPTPLSYIPGIGLLARGAGLVVRLLSAVVSPLERVIGAGNLPPPNGTVSWSEGVRGCVRCFRLLLPSYDMSGSRMRGLKQLWCARHEAYPVCCRGIGPPSARVRRKQLKKPCKCPLLPVTPVSAVAWRCCRLCARCGRRRRGAIRG